MKKIVAVGALMLGLGLGCGKPKQNTGVWKKGVFVPIEEPLTNIADFKMLQIDVVNSGGGLIKAVIKENGTKKEARFYYSRGAIDPNTDYFIAVADDSVFALKTETIADLEFFLKYRGGDHFIVFNPNNSLVASCSIEEMKK